MKADNIQLKLERYSANQNLLEYDMNDHECFQNCDSKETNLFCCDTCFRVFHQKCYGEFKKTNYWSCRCCQFNSVCSTCLKIVDQKQQKFMVCTICYQPIHLECSSTPAQILDLSSYMLKGNHHVCSACLQQYGIHSIIRSKPVKIGKRQIQTYYFVSVNYGSRIHCGWFPALSVQISLKVKPISHKKSSINIPSIQKIVKLRPPIQYRNLNIVQTAQFLMKNERKSNLKYGRLSNYQFLVKWKGKNYDSLSWQDEITVNQLGQTALIKYLYHKNIQITLIKQNKRIGNSSMIDFLKSKRIMRPAVKFEEKIKYIVSFMKRNKEFKVQMVGYSPSQKQLMAQTLSSFINIQFLQKFPYTPSIIMIPKTEFKQISSQIAKICNFFNVLVFRGNTTSIQTILEQDFMYMNTKVFKFQLMLITYEGYMFRKEILHQKIQAINTLFFINPTKNELPCLDHLLMLKFTKRVVYLFEMSEKVKQFSNLIINRFHENTPVLIHDLECKIIKESTKEKKPIIENNRFQWSQLKRVAFLRFILAFGLVFQSIEQLKDKLIKFDDLIFTKEKTSPEECKMYLHHFVGILGKCKEGSFTLEQKDYILFGFSIQKVVKVVCQFDKLNSAIKQFRQEGQYLNLPTNIKMRTIFSEQIRVPWNENDDIVLGSLILEEGFERWQKIASNREWTDYLMTGSHNDTTTQNKSFAEYLQEKFMQSGIQKEDCNAYDFIQARGRKIFFMQ